MATTKPIEPSATHTLAEGLCDEIRQMKQLADEINISLLLVHHLRKQDDSDPLNTLLGTTEIIGAVDSVFVLDKSKRNENG